MKPYAAQTHYELLEISVSAGPAEIRAAWERLNRLYADDQVALYGLADEGASSALRARLLEALEVLTDEGRRDVYDAQIGLPPRAAPLVEPPQPVAAPKSTANVSAPPSAPVRASAPSVALPPPPSAPVPAALEAPPEPPAPVLPPPAPSAPEAPPPSAPRPRASSPLAPPDLQLPAPMSSPPRPGPSAPDRARLPDLPPDAEYNGELLRRVRSALGITLPQLAERTRIGAKHLENVEADRYEALPTTVYLRGILMSIARELRLDGLKVSRSYLGLVEQRRAKG